MDESEKQFMDAAFEQAREALAAGEVPVGCVFVRDDVIVARGRNTVNLTRNASRHAEMNCIDQVLSKGNKLHEKTGKSSGLNERHDIGNIFSEIDVFVTVEPCAMCADALGQLKVRRVFFGCSNDRFGGCGSVIDAPGIFNYDIDFKRDVCKKEAVQLLKDFYKGENPNAPTGKAKRKAPRNNS